jgi:hypothetical protein
MRAPQASHARRKDRVNLAKSLQKKETIGTGPMVPFSNDIYKTAFCGPEISFLLHAIQAGRELAEHARNSGRQDRHYDYEHEAHGSGNEAVLNSRRAGLVVDELLHLNLQDYSTAPGSSYNGASCAVSVNHGTTIIITY